MKLLRTFAQEAVVSIGILLLSTSMIFFVAFYATGDLQKEKLGIALNETALQAYVSWWNAALHGNFAGEFGTQERLRENVVNGLEQTVTLVVLTLAISLAISLAIALYLIRNPGRLIAAAVERTMYFSGAVPVFLIAILVYAAFMRYNILPMIDPRNSFAENLFPYSIAAVVLSLGSGVTGELVRLFKLELGKILGQMYIQAVRIRSANVTAHVARAALVPMSSMLVAKIPYFIGASIIVEDVFGIKGLGHLMVESGESANFGLLMTVSLCFVLIVLTARMLNKFIVVLFDPRMA